MAGGLPVVASRIRGNVDIIQSGMNGYLASPLETSEWEKALYKLINDKQLRAKYSEAAIGVIDKYSNNSVLNELLDIYRLRG